MPKVTIAGRSIGDGCPPFVIAEAGINHNGELSKALEMIAVAHSAGADAIKFQTYKAEEFVGDPNLMFTYRSQGKEVTESMLAMFQRYEFTKAEWIQIKQRCDQTGILFLSTPQNVSDLILLRELGVQAIKVGSDDFTNLPLLREYASTGLPIVISTGMANLAEIYQSLEALGSLDGYPTILLHCISQYPTPPQDINLLKLKTLRHAFPMVVIGFSDHSYGPLASGAAVAMGAALLEKHFTLSHDLPGPDHEFSEDPKGLGEWIHAIRTTHQMLGTPIVRPTKAEEREKPMARRSVTALRDIEAGELLSKDNVGLRRPGIGLAAAQFDQVLGTKARRPILKGIALKLGDFN